MKALADIIYKAEFKHSSPYHSQKYDTTKQLRRILSLLVGRRDQRDWDEHFKYVEYVPLVGAQALLGRASPLLVLGGWNANVWDRWTRDRGLKRGGLGGREDEMDAGLESVRHLAM
jgi:hypothetical protein